MTEAIVNSFDIWTDAQGIKSKTRIRSVDNISLKGIASLRELILNLAVRGKLIPIQPKDEPAILLLKKIEKEKETLLKAGKIKKQTILPKIGKDEKPFELNNNWEWTRLQSLVTLLGDGLHGTPVYTPGTKYFFINGNNLSNGKIEIKPDTKTVSEDEMLKYKKELNLRTVLVSINGTLGNVAFYNGEEIMLGKSACYFNLSEYVFKNYIKLIIESPYFRTFALKKSTGTTINNLGLMAMNEFPIPLPPLSEQKRIVAKVDELMALCDKLEAEQFKNLKTHQVLVKTLLDTLTQAKDSDELQVAWGRLSTHFDTLFCTDDSIDQLKQTILQLAVMGKLVNQNPKDEPASELIKKISKAKEKLIEEGKIKKQSPLNKISGDEKSFELPNGWVWCRLNEVAKQITDGEHITPPRIESGFKLLSAKNVREGFIDYENCDYVSQDIYEKCIKRCNPEIGDLLIISVGGTIGRTSLITKDIPFVIVRSVAMIKPLLIESKYLELVMNSPLLQKIIENKSRGGAQPCLYLNEIVKFSFPLPPLAEQPRIAAKVNELFALCESLKNKVKKSQDLKVLLSKTIVEKAVQ